MKKDQWTLLEVLRWTTGRFQERGLPSPRLDAEILIAAALQTTRVQLYVQFERPLTAIELALIREHVRRRQAGESVAYIVGHKEFFGLEFAVDSRVLVPRPDTETLVDEALARLRERASEARSPRASDERSPLSSGEGMPEGAVAPMVETLSTAPASEEAPAPLGGLPPSNPPTPLPAAASPGSDSSSPPAGGGERGCAPLVVADVGTGSGAVVVALAKQLSSSSSSSSLSFFAVDRSADALDVARLNATRHGVAVTFLHGDLGGPLIPHAPFDLLVANLPYIPTGEISGLSAEVKGEPRDALDGGADGLDLVRRLVAAAPALLSKGGILALEIGLGQAAQTAALCAQAGLTDIRLRRDLGAVDRVVSAVRP